MFGCFECHQFALSIENQEDCYNRSILLTANAPHRTQTTLVVLRPAETMLLFALPVLVLLPTLFVIIVVVVVGCLITSLNVVRAVRGDDIDADAGGTVIVRGDNCVDGSDDDG